MKYLPFLALILLPACSGTPVDAGSDAGSDVVSAVDTGRDVVSAVDVGTDVSTVTDGGRTHCGPMDCEAGQVCMRTLVEGGVFIGLDDAGMCPSGWVADPDAGRPCRRQYTYSCPARPTACTGEPTCACAGSLCVVCEGTTGNEVDCLTPVP